MAPRVDIQYVQFYTQGNTARRVATQIPVHTGALPQVKRRKVKRVYVDPVAIFGVAVALCMLVMMLVGVAQLKREQAEIVAMEQQIELLQEKNTALQARFDAECDLDAVKETALALGMVPKENVPQADILVDVPQLPEPEPITIWQRIGTFLTGLFA
jgi:cell division protein FtsL